MLTKYYERLTPLLDSLRHPLLLMIRLYWGWQFFLTGRGKLMHLDRVTDWFASLGIPAPGLNAAFVGSLEVVGGLLLIAGLGSRLISIPLTVNMCVAYIMADREALLGVFKDPDSFLTAEPFLFLYASVIILVFGPGLFSIDAIIRKKFGGKKDATT